MTDREVKAWVEAFVARESEPERLDAWADRVHRVVVPHSAEVAGDAALSRMVRDTIASHWRSFLATLKDPQYEVPLVQTAVEMAMVMAARGFPLTMLFHLYRVAQQEVWRYMTAVALEADASGAGPDRVGAVDSAELLVFLWGRASTWLDYAVEASAEVFTAERDRIRRGSAAEQLDAVRALLADDPRGRDPKAALGDYPISSHNTAMILHADSYQRIEELNVAVQHLGSVLRVRHPLVVSPGGRDLWCWFGSRSAPALTVLDACEGWLNERGIAVSVGTPTPGLAGFRISHQEAQQAERIAFAGARSSGLVRYADVEVLCLISGRPEAARRFVARTLGPLGEPGEQQDRLRQTLRALLRTGSVDEAARMLSVHKNTVRYRTSQAEELLGRPVNEATSELELALRYHAYGLDTAISDA